MVLVTWRDAWFDFDEPDPEDARADYLVTTVGFVVRETPTFLSVAQEMLPDGDGYRAVTHIPRAVIVDVTELQPCNILKEVVDGEELCRNEESSHRLRQARPRS